MMTVSDHDHHAHQHLTAHPQFQHSFPYNKAESEDSVITSQGNFTDPISLLNVVDVKVVANLDNISAGSYIPCYKLRFHPHPYTFNLQDLSLSASTVSSSIDMLLLLASAATANESQSVDSTNNKTQLQSYPSNSTVLLGSTYLDHCGGPWTEVQGPPFTVTLSQSNVVIQIETPPSGLSSNDRPPLLRSGLDIGAVRLLPVHPRVDSPEPKLLPTTNLYSKHDIKPEPDVFPSRAPSSTSPMNHTPFKAYHTIDDILNADEDIVEMSERQRVPEMTHIPAGSETALNLDQCSEKYSDPDHNIVDPYQSRSTLKRKYSNAGYEEEEEDDEHELGNVSTTSTDQDYPGRVYECPEPTCERIFSRPFNLKAHAIIHSPVRNRTHKCSSCELSFCRSQDLLRHMQIHNRTITYTCPGCSKVFSRKDALRRHQRSSRTCPLFNDQPIRRGRKEQDNPISTPKSDDAACKLSPTSSSVVLSPAPVLLPDLPDTPPVDKGLLKIVQYVPGRIRGYWRRSKSSTTDDLSYPPPLASPPSTDCDSLNSTSSVVTTSSGAGAVDGTDSQRSY
ncbi:hypothetical protein BASA50_011147 [Batrachochytrium salamandrivorans]|uniref:C2H2-type domain-containing protein n=1 Tax=Batrachochytrium salamandrivorans TaxID=1357716 RepID=A0ABQ8EWL4_9FUNG|nr:hypothetical protein BASA62_004522 [Batrachochytrium salamandrivorans]KAH6582610.1 hypothetical protein BASA60_001855 [Batrachochytrium salamandrivorans]KAH6587756.1 hypothetical protein BASA50_011147 [Batrachochytrium salamandrivorans]KAH6589042.1 hypothetical protein BASA61_005746 [Batrachochytrium salamandrivorans]KAJ1332420.1 hypothetical protein BSLG_008722 [Batrachochytrium salamandrivorans]